MQIRDWALKYASIGWYVFPVNKDKEPLTQEGLTNGWKNATIDPGQIDRWSWTTGIGVATQPSGLVVFDVDVKPATVDRRAKNGFVELEIYEEQNGPLPENVVATTGGGSGRHYVFAAPANLRLHKTDAIRDCDVLGNGYFLVEPSTNQRGAYEWMIGCDPFENELAPLPTWIAEVCGATIDRPGFYSKQSRASGIEIVSERDVEQIISALEVLNPNMGGLDWVNVGAAIHAAFGGSMRGFRIWDEWSQKATRPKENGRPLYNERELKARWAGFDEWGGVGLGTLFHMAKDAGWTRDEVAIKRAAEQTSDPDAWLECLKRARDEVQDFFDTGTESGLGPLEFQDARSLLNEDLPNPEWLVSGLLVDKSVYVISGEPKTFKTWAGLEIMLSCVGEGKHNFAFGSLECRGGRRVAALFAEDSKRSIKKRIKSFMASKGMEADNIPEGAFMIKSMDFNSDLGDENHVAKIIASVWYGMGDADVVYLDPLREFHGGDENDSRAMHTVARALRAIRTILDCTVIFVHHSAKISQSVHGRRPGQMMRGSSALHGAVDGGLYLTQEHTDLETHWTNKAASENKAARGLGMFRLQLDIEDDLNGNAVAAHWTYTSAQEMAQQKQEKEEEEISTYQSRIDLIEEIVSNEKGISKNALVRAVQEKDSKASRRQVEKGISDLVKRKVLLLEGYGQQHSYRINNKWENDSEKTI